LELQSDKNRVLGVYITLDLSVGLDIFEPSSKKNILLFLFNIYKLANNRNI